MALGDLDSRVVRRGLPASDEELTEVALHVQDPVPRRRARARCHPRGDAALARHEPGPLYGRHLLRALVFPAHDDLLQEEHAAAPPTRDAAQVGFALADYFSKRFLRVYPLFAAVACFVWMLPFESQMVYFLNGDSTPGDFDLFKVLTFEFPQRYHAFWTLPLEIAYYFLIPFCVLAVIRLKKTEYRDAHQPLQPHLPTLISSSMAAVIYLKIDEAMKRNTELFTLKKWQVVSVRAIEWTALALLLSGKGGTRFISLHAGLLIVIEMLLPLELSAVFEWSLLHYWGKISFSVYLLHSFVVYSPQIHGQKNYYDALFSQLFLTCVLATASYYAVEYPSQVLSTKISKALARLESDGALPRTSSTFALYSPVATTGDHSSHVSAA